MSKRPDMTVVIRSNGLLLRSDVGGDGSVSSWRGAWPELAAAVTHALTEGGPAGKRVWVLDSSVWLGVVELPGGAVAGLSDQELVEPAAFEAESLGGLEPASAVTAVQRRRMADLEDDFLVVQVPKEEVTAVGKAVRRAKGRLAGIGHPAGLPDALVADELPTVPRDGGWRRVEFWQEQVVLVEAATGSASLIPLDAAPEADWRRALAPHLRRGEPVAQEQTLVDAEAQVRGGRQWQEQSTLGEGTARWLSAAEGADALEPELPTWDLAADAAAESFAVAWARCLAPVESPKTGVIPTVRPPSAPTDRWPAAAAGAVAFLLAVAVVWLQRSMDQEELNVLQAQLDFATAEQRVVTERRQQVRDTNSAVRLAERSILSLEQELVVLNRGGSAGADRRAALAAMMAALGRFVTEDLVIQSIDYKRPRHAVAGVALAPEAASRLAGDLSEELREYWRVSPARIEPQAGAGRMVWRFSITLEPGQLTQVQQ
ncbi:MAG: hypothetical protein AAGE01_06265 [Pseudomonadota bacterium]